MTSFEECPTIGTTIGPARPQTFFGSRRLARNFGVVAPLKIPHVSLQLSEQKHFHLTLSCHHRQGRIKKSLETLNTRDFGAQNIASEIDAMS